jgi:hypothetical protein
MVGTQKRIFQRFTLGAPLKRVWASPVKFRLAFSPPPMETKEHPPREKERKSKVTPYSPVLSVSGLKVAQRMRKVGDAPSFAPHTQTRSLDEERMSVTQVKLATHPSLTFKGNPSIIIQQNYRTLFRASQSGTSMVPRALNADHPPCEHSSCGRSSPACC